MKDEAWFGDPHTAEQFLAAARKSLDDDFAEWESALEMPLGPLMRALLRLEQRIGRLHALELYLLPRIEDPALAYDGVVPFATTGFDSEQFAFVVDADADPELTTDERPICLVEKGDVHIVAPHLRGFLSVVAVAGAYAIRRDEPDAEYFTLRDWRVPRSHEEHSFGTIAPAQELLAGGDEFLRASAALCTLPGVVLAERPSDIVSAHPDRAFKKSVEETLMLNLPAFHALLAEGDHARAKLTLERLVAMWLNLGDLVPAANWAALNDAIVRVRPDVSDEQRAELRSRGAWRA